MNTCQQSRGTCCRSATAAAAVAVGAAEDNVAETAIDELFYQLSQSISLPTRRAGFGRRSRLCSLSVTNINVYVAVILHIYIYIYIYILNMLQ